MRIAVLILNLEAGGAQRTATTLANHWSESGHDVSILSYNRQAPPHFPLREGIRLQPLDLRRDSPSFARGMANNWRRIVAVRGALKALRPDVVVSHMDRESVVALLATVGLRMPVIVRSASDPAFTDIGRPWHLLRRLMYRRAAAIVVQTERARQFYVGWTGQRSTVIPNPARKAPAQVQPTFRLRRPVIVAIGNLNPNKNQGLLLQAFAQLPDEFSSWSVALVGDGPSRDAFEHQTDELGIRSRVTFTGIVASSYDALSQADLFVLTSRREGFPNVLTEALASGVPAIATDCPSGPREILRDGIDGLLVPVDDAGALADALATLMRDPSLRERMARQAVQVTDRFAEKDVAAKWETVLRATTSKALRDRHKARKAGGGAP